MPERRQHVRILTLKNLGVSILVAVVLLVGANLLSELRKTKEGDFGGLFKREVKTETVAPRTYQVVTETPSIEDHEASDPTLLAPAVRQQQYLEPNEIVPRAQAVAATQTAPAPVSASASDHRRLAIVGDADGVAVVGARRVLSGGFGR